MCFQLQNFVSSALLRFKSRFEVTHLRTRSGRSDWRPAGLNVSEVSGKTEWKWKAKRWVSDCRKSYCRLSDYIMAYCRLTGDWLQTDRKAVRVLGVFAKLRKAIASFVNSIRPSAWNNSARTERTSIKSDIWMLLENLWKKFEFY